MIITTHIAEIFTWEIIYLTLYFVFTYVQVCICMSYGWQLIIVIIAYYVIWLTINNLYYCIFRCINVEEWYLLCNKFVHSKTNLLTLQTILYFLVMPQTHDSCNCKACMVVTDSHANNDTCFYLLISHSRCGRRWWVFYE